MLLRLTPGSHWNKVRALLGALLGGDERGQRSIHGCTMGAPAGLKSVNNLMICDKDLS